MYLTFLCLFVVYIVGTAAQSSTIPGTYLSTYRAYRFKLKRFPNGALTWTNEVHGLTGARYTIVDNRDSSSYDKGGKWYQSGQWTIKPFSGRNGTIKGWYLLVNNAIPGEYLTISEAGETNGYAANKSYLLLQPNYYPDVMTQAEIDRFLWKPQMYGDDDGNVYYWLINKALPQGVATWTDKKYRGNDGYYTQLDNSGDARYSYGGEWFDDKLFIFED